LRRDGVVGKPELAMARVSFVENFQMSTTNLTALQKRIVTFQRKREQQPQRYCNQKCAAKYIGRSREYLRLLHLRGGGPRRMPNGFYAYDDLDAWMRGESHEATGDAA
jgi:hypothetical protein